MRQQLLILASMCTLLTACEPAKEKTILNSRSRNEKKMSAANPKEAPNDQALTQKIRAVIIDNDSLSTNAKNVKISSANGAVTLNGPVNNESEKNDLARIVKSIRGVHSVDNQLEVAP